MNSKIKNTLTKYNENNINKLDIYFGKFENSITFNKNLNNNFYEKFYKYIVEQNFQHKKYENTIINNNNQYLNKSKNKCYIKKNINNVKGINCLYIYYNEIIEDYSNFSCSRNYNTLKQKINEFKINNEIYIYFTENQIKISVELNHNIDLTIPLLEKLLAISI